MGFGLMSGTVRDSVLWMAVFTNAAITTLFLSADARADDDCPPTQELICPSSQNQPADNSCLKPGATFVQQDSRWKLVTDSIKIAQNAPNKNTGSRSLA